jgi:uncharacterized protein YoaH (UPF0181 family)
LPRTYSASAAAYFRRSDCPRRYLVPEQHKALRRIRKLHAEGMASRAISADLAQRGIKVSHVTITKIVASAAAGRSAP